MDQLDCQAGCRGGDRCFREAGLTISQLAVSSPASEAAPANLTAAALDATRWNYLGFVCRGVSALVVSTVLARLLGPKPFGQIAVATVVFGLANLIADAGFSAALVQMPVVTGRQIRMAFSLQIGVGCVIAAAVFLVAPAVSAAFHDPGVLPVVRAVAPVFIFQSLGQTATGLLKRQMRFRALQIAQVASYLAGYAGVGIVLALCGFGVWSLVAAQLSQALLYSIFVYATVRHPVTPSIDHAGWRVARFGAQVTGANIVNWLIVNLDNVFVGRTFGPFNLGLYSRSFNLAITPVEGFVTACQQVLFSSSSRAFAENGAQPRFERMARAYLSAAAIVSLAVMPAFWSLAACSRVVILALYGPQWTGAVSFFTAFAAAMPCFALMAMAGPMLNAADRVQVEIRSQILTLAVTATAFAVASRFSPLAIAWAVPVCYAFRFWSVTRPTLRMLHLRWRDLGAVIAAPAAIAAVSTCAVLLANRLLSPAGNSLLAFAALAGVGFASAVSTAWLFRRSLLPGTLLPSLRARSQSAPAWMALLLRPFLYATPAS